MFYKVSFLSMFSLVCILFCKKKRLQFFFDVFLIVFLVTLMDFYSGFVLGGPTGGFWWFLVLVCLV